jgi:hypothetical protein
VKRGDPQVDDWSLASLQRSNMSWPGGVRGQLMQAGFYQIDSRDIGQCLSEQWSEAKRDASRRPVRNPMTQRRWGTVRYGTRLGVPWRWLERVGIAWRFPRDDLGFGVPLVQVANLDEL